jgi:opacity protein-like surface antigen
MKKLLIATVVAAISTGALAADLKPYIEGQLGWSNLKDVQSNTYSTSFDGGTASGSFKTEYDSSVSGGIELGIKNIGIENLRLGASYQTMKFDMEKVTGTGTIAGTTGDILPNGTETGDITSDVRSVGINLDNRVNLYMANAYYDFKNSSPFTPFIGLGIGMADVKNAKDNEFAWSTSLGGKYNVTSNVYLGVKAAYTNVNGITDKLGIQYEDHKAYSGHALLGYEF